MFVKGSKATRLHIDRVIVRLPNHFPYELQPLLPWTHLQLIENQGCRFVPDKHVPKHSATDGTKRDLNIGETRV